jgi:hypothetical protein
MAGLHTNGLPLVAPGLPGAGVYTTLTGYELVPADTGRATTTGAAPASVAVSLFQIAALAGSIALNTATEAANAATLSTLSGRIVTAGTAVAANATFIITVTNTLVTTASVIQTQLSPGTNTVPGMIVQSVVPAAGSFVVTLRNTGTAASNGTMILAFQIAAA